MQVLLVDPDSALPPGVAHCLSEDGWRVRTACDYRQAAEGAWLETVQAVVLHQPHGPGAGPQIHSDYGNLMRAIDTRRIGAVLLAGDPVGVKLTDDTLIDVAQLGVTKEEIRGRLAVMRRYQALLRGVEREVANLERVGTRINQQFSELDQDMQLAGRLQRDFLPKESARIGPAEFATLFRPVACVSGDIYDIFRIGERHLGFYVADAVGHGMAASLLTMFIKHAVSADRLTADGCAALDPAKTMVALNAALSGQHLPHCQFVTCAYCILDTQTLELRFARGGHPYPLHLPYGGRMTELPSSGGLLGLFEGESFAGGQVQLHPGDKVLLHSDGLETSFAPRDGETRGWEHYRGVLEGLAAQPVAGLVGELDAMLNSEAGSLNPQDDVTLVAMQVQV